MGQVLTCPSPNLYFDALPNIISYNPALPLSASNPSTLSIALPAINGNGLSLALMANINGGTLSPTFYTIAYSHYYYWDGSSWVDTGHTGGGNIGGCGSALYSINSGAGIVYKYTGTANSVSLVALPPVPMADLVVDCYCNFYVFYVTGTNGGLDKYSPTGSIIASYSVTGLPSSGTSGAGFGIVGSDVYCLGNNNTLYKGTLGGAGSTIAFSAVATLTSLSTAGTIYDWASCGAIPSPLFGTLVTTPFADCSGASITASITGNSPLTYTWSGPGISGSVNDSIITATASGIYTCAASAPGQCLPSQITLTTAINISTPPSLTVSLSSNSLCAQMFNGSPNTITFTANGANTYTIITPNVIYNSNPSGPVSMLNPQPPYEPTGPVTATLYGSNGACTVSTTVVFTVIPNPTISVSNPTPFICAGQSYTYTSFGADSYTWSAANPGTTVYTTGSVVVSSPTINSVISVIGSSLGCNSALQSNTITIEPLPQVSVLPDPALVCTGSSINLEAIGNGSSYDWYPVTWLSSAAGATTNANPPVQQSYTVVASLNSCTSSAVVTVSVLPLPVPVIYALKQSVCLNDSIILQGGGGLDYSWSAPGNYVYTGSELRIKAFSAAGSGIYTLTVSNQAHCTASATESITVFNLPYGYIRPDHAQGCAPFCTNMVFQPGPASAPLASISLQVNANSVTGYTLGECFNSPGDYLVTGFFTDINTCASTTTLLIHAYSKPSADFSFSPLQPVESLEEVQFTNESKGAAQFSWDFGNRQTSSLQNPYFLYADAGSYPIALVATNSFGCSDTAVKIITVAPDFAVYIPDAFTPNSDGINDLFRPVMRGVAEFTFWIFDRWGEELFATSEPGGGWNGSYNGKPCQQDNYVWKLRLSTQGHLSDPDHLNGKETRTMTGQVFLYR